MLATLIPLEFGLNRKVLSLGDGSILPMWTTFLLFNPNQLVVNRNQMTEWYLKRKKEKKKKKPKTKCTYKLNESKKSHANLE